MKGNGVCVPPATSPHLPGNWMCSIFFQGSDGSGGIEQTNRLCLDNGHLQSQIIWPDLFFAETLGDKVRGKRLLVGEREGESGRERVIERRRERDHRTFFALLDIRLSLSFSPLTLFPTMIPPSLFLPLLSHSFLTPFPQIYLSFQAGSLL